MIRRGIAAGLLALSLACSPAFAGPQVYYLVGVGLGQLGDDVDAYLSATAPELGAAVGGTWLTETRTRLGFDAGVGFGYPVYAPLSVGLEAHFASRGTKWNYTEPDSGWKVEQSLALNYLEFPLLLRAEAYADAAVHPSVFLGPVLGVRVGSKTSSAATGRTLIEDETNAYALVSYLSSVDLSDFAKDSYVGGVIGAGVQIRTTQTTSFLLQARYQKAFGNVLEDAAGYDFRPQDWTFALGMTFQL